MKNKQEVTEAIDILKCSNAELAKYIDEMNRKISSLREIEPKNKLVIKGYETADKCKKEHRAVELAIKALEKQIPMETIETQELIEIEYICPVCDCTNGSRFEYCWKCGQKLSH